MKKTGVIILLVGLLFTVAETIGLLVKEHVTDPNKMKITQTKIHRQIWGPLIGTIVLFVGFGIYKSGKKSEAKLPVVV